MLELTCCETNDLNNPIVGLLDGSHFHVPATQLGEEDASLLDRVTSTAFFRTALRWDPTNRPRLSSNFELEGHLRNARGFGKVTSNVTWLTLSRKHAIEGVDHGIENRGFPRPGRTSNGEHAVLAKLDEVNFDFFGVRTKSFNGELERPHASTALSS